MTQVTTVKLAVVSTMVGALLLLGAFLIVSPMASAQTPPPEPTPSQTQPRPTPEGDQPAHRSREDCPKDEADGESTTGVRGGPRSFRQ